MESSDIMAEDAKKTADTVQVVAMCVISFLGLVFNVVVFIMIIVLGEYKKTSHWYVLNLAIADGIFLLFLPLAAMEKLAEEWKFGEASCKIYNGVFYVNYYSSIFFLTVMSFDRYVAIVFPMSPTWRKFRSRLGATIITVLVWTAAIAASLPLLLHAKLIDLNHGDLEPTAKYKCVLDFYDKNNSVHQCIKGGMSPDCKLPELHFGENTTGPFLLISDGSADDKLPEIPMILENPELIKDTEYDDYFSPPTNNETGYDFFGASNNTDIFNETGYDFFGASNNTDIFTKDIFDEIDKETPVTEADEGYCLHKPYPIFIGWIYANITVAYIVPVLVIVFCYGCILWRILHPKIKTAQSALQKDRGKSFLMRRFSSTSSQQKRNNRATILVISLVTAFLLCWTPFQVINVLKIHRLSEDIHTCRILTKVSNFLAYSSSLLNPLLYTFLGANFIKRLRRVLHKIRGRQAHRPVFRRASRSNGRASMTSKSTKSVSDSMNFQHINMQLLHPYHKREPSLS